MRAEALRYIEVKTVEAAPVMEVLGKKADLSFKKSEFVDGNPAIHQG